MANITRDCMTVSATIMNGDNLSSAILMKGYAGMLVNIPASWTAADLGAKVSEDGLVYSPLRDRSGNLVKVTSIQTAEADWYEFPGEIFAAAYCKLWSINTVTGADLAQAAARSLVVILKG